MQLWLGLESQGPRPRLHLCVHFAGQIDKKTSNIILPEAHSLQVKFGSDRESNIPYLSICSALPLEGLGPILN